MFSNVCDDTKIPDLHKIAEQDPVFGNKIIANLAAYSSHCKFCDFWVGYSEDNEPVSAVSYLGGVYIVVANEKANLEEIAEFFAFMPKGKVVGQLEVVKAATKKLEGTMNTSKIMAYTGGPKYVPEDLVVRADSLSNVFDLLCESYPGFKDDTMKDAWIYDISLRVRWGLCYCCCIHKNNRLVSTGMIASAGDHSVVLGSIATLEDQRGHGYGKAVVNHLCNVALRRAKRPYVCCRSSEIVPYYENLHFKVVGDWGIFTAQADDQKQETTQAE